MAVIVPSSVSRAVINNDVEKLSQLIKNGKRIDIQDNLGYTPLHIAAKKLNLDCLEILLQHPDCPINVQSSEGFTSLYILCAKKQSPIKIIKKILKQGADPNIGNNEQITPLHMACGEGDLKLAKALLNHGADINKIDFDGYTPLHWAVDKSQKEMVHFLLHSNADTSIKDLFGLNPLMLSIVRKSIDIFDLVLPFTENLNSIGKADETAVGLAIQIGNFEMVKKLIESGADINRIDSSSPLVVSKLYEPNNSQIFQYVWSHLDFKILRSNHCFISKLRDLTIQENIVAVKHILNTENLDLRYRGAFFCDLFSLENNNPTEQYFEDNKQNLFTIIEGLHRQEIYISFSLIRQFIDFIYLCPYRLELLQLFLDKLHFTVDEGIVFLGFLSRLDVGLLLLENISHTANIIKLYDLLIPACQVDSIKYIMKFHSPSNLLLLRFFGLITDKDDDQLTKQIFIKSWGKVQSLVELSRDVLRNYVGESIVDYRNYRKLFSISIQNLNCTQRAKDILMLKYPVNNVTIS